VFAESIECSFLLAYFVFLQKMNRTLFGKKIVDWYAENKRRLPWRDTTDPYKIWLSEVILQQTRVAQGLPYYERFIKTFPTVFDLAKAPVSSVLRLWQGLGYYSRARNLHACAKSVVDDFGGKFPSTFEELKKLKGIGPYTAAAIASIAFRESVAVVDGNVYRVLARVFGIDLDIASTEGKVFFFDKANELISTHEPDLFNQAMMEFGALHCLPQNPKCEECVFAKTCVANQRGLQKELPVKLKKTKVRKRYLYYFIIGHNSKILMKERGAKDIWQGLYDFYLVETKRNKKIENLLKENQWLMGFQPTAHSKTIKHILSHQQLMVRFVQLEVKSKTNFTQLAKTLNMKAYSNKQIESLPKPILIGKYLRTL
jgi:A/G-specific adenine glycosylase